MEAYENAVFISYAWGGENEQIVNQIETSLQARGLNTIRDKRDLGYKGSLKEFMDRIGQGNCVIVVMSDKYLRSPNCMIELLEIAENNQFHDRVFPIILADVNIYDPVKRIEYVKYWEAKRAELAEAMKDLDSANLQGVRADIDLYASIRDKISGLTSILMDMNTLTPDMYRNTDFSDLYNALEKGMKENKAEKPTPSGGFVFNAPVTATTQTFINGNVDANSSERKEEESALSSPTTAKPPKGGEVVVGEDNSIAVGNIQVGGHVGNIVIGQTYYQMSNSENVERMNQQFSRRLLNAGFARPNGQMLNREQALSSNNFYNLLIDVGPRWQDSQSLVVESEQASFPEDKLPADQQGYQVRIMFVSEDFSPNLATAEMWVPAQKGQSYPFVDGKRADAPGPVKLRVRAPRLGLFQRQGRAHGRLCLYYKGQLIQSALVSVGIAHLQGGKLEEPNKIDVDYVLTADFEASKRFSDRRVQFGIGEEHPVSVGLTLNDDGSGRHRILATYHLNSKDESTVPPAWTPYDSQSAQQTLIEFRNVMAECYKGLNDNLGKDRKQFSYDLLELAKLGDRLRALALSDLDVSGTGKTVALWRRELLTALKTATVIQVARTGPANYVFPWALVYEHPLPGPKYELCKIIEEWDVNGIRNKNTEIGCPYQDEGWHQQNIICPYGFWGYKHIIEQPTGAIHKQGNHWIFDVTDKISVRKEVDFGVGVTNDIDQAARDQHLIRLASNMKARLNPQLPARDRKSVLAMLQAPEIVYFLCHGEIDSNQVPYLSIGEHINHPDYEIFPNTLEQWSLLTQGGLDLSLWQMIRPLVFINGCHTAQLRPGVVLNFVSAFSDLGASGVIGTEVSVQTDMAMAIAEAILGRIANGLEVGQAVREMRWEMLNRGNLLGLAYTPYSLANLHIERDT